MRIDERFYTAFLSGSSKRKIFGRNIRPYCLRHHLVLTAMEHPFVRDDKFCTHSDLITLAIVLSGKTVDDMLSPPTFKDIFHSKMLTLSTVYFTDCLEALRNHTEENAYGPKFWSKDKKGKSRGVPWEANITASLCTSGIPIEDVMTLPLSQVLWLHSVWSIQQGADIDILSAEEEAIMESMSDE